MTELLSINSYTGDGTTVSFSVTFPYILASHVVVSVDNEIVGYEFTTPSQITFSSAPGVDAVVQFRRRTPAEELIALVQGKSVLKSAELNLVFTQLLYIMQEAFDIANILDESTLSIAAALAEIQAALAEIRILASNIAYQYDAIFSIPFRPSDGELLATLPFVRSVRLVAGGGGSRAYTSSVSDAGDVTLSIEKNGVEVGTVTFLQDINAGTVVVPSDVTFIDGDRLTLRCTTGSTSFRDFGVTLKLRREVA